MDGQPWRRVVAHPLTVVLLVAFAALTLRIVTSPLPVLLDAVLHDDSFYYLQTARNLAAGFGSTFDQVNFTNGYQPGWFLVLAALAYGGASHVLVTAGIMAQSALFAAGAVLLMVVLVRQGLPALAAVAAVGVVFVVIVPVLGWDLLEGGLNLLMSTALLMALVRFEAGEASPFVLGLAVSMAFLARTDHGLFVPIAGAMVLWRRREGPVGTVARDALAYAAPVAVIIGGYLLINVATTGHIMPISGRLKAFWAEGSVRPPIWTELLTFDLRQSWKLGALVAIGLVARDAWRRRPSGLGAYAAGALAIFAYYAVVQWQGFTSIFWYYVPLYSLTAVGLAWILAALLTTERHARLVQGAIVGAVVVLLGGRGWTIDRYRYRPEAERADILRVAEQLNRLKAGRHARAAAWDAGILGYYAGPVTNLDGLINSAEYFERYYSQGRVLEYIRENRFTYVVCYASYVAPGASAEGLLSDYRAVYSGLRWVILERQER